MRYRLVSEASHRFKSADCDHLAKSKARVESGALTFSRLLSTYKLRSALRPTYFVCRSIFFNNVILRVYSAVPCITSLSEALTSGLISGFIITKSTFRKKLGQSPAGFAQHCLQTLCLFWNFLFLLSNTLSSLWTLTIFLLASMQFSAHQLVLSDCHTTVHNLCQNALVAPSRSSETFFYWIFLVGFTWDDRKTGQNCLA